MTEPHHGSASRSSVPSAAAAPPPSAAPLRPRPAGVYRYHPARPYNGFSTSICSLFQYSPSDENAEDSTYQTSTTRTDCCSLACFGILQSDRTRYLLTGQLPPSLFRRMWIHVFVPLSMFLLAGCAAVTIQDQYSNSFIVTCLVILLIIYIAADCFRGTVKRRRVREELLWRLRELDMIDQGRGEEAIETELMVREAGSREDGTYGPVDLGQPKHHMDCVHRILGCAWVDYPNGDGSGEPIPSDFCGKLWNCFANLCCGKVCRCWFQWCGLCALAQEAREVERLIPAGRRRVDYVTFEPYLSYYNPIRMLRSAGNSSNLLAHYATLSHLSSTLVRMLAISVMTMLVLSFIPRFGGFTKGDLCVLVATLCQAFLILWLVHWKFHRFDISLDAVIKYFACGFILVTGLAVFFELIEAIFIHLFLVLAISLSGITKVQSQDFGGGIASFGKLGSRFVSNSLSGGHGRFLQDQAEDMSKTFAKEFPIITCIYLFVNAFLMAAMVEELSKFFGFRMVEHPDFLRDDQLQEGAEAVAAAERRAQREAALENEESEYDDEEDSEDGNPASPGRDCAAYEAMGDTMATTVDSAVNAAAAAVGATSPRVESNLNLAPAPPKTLNGRGAAITVAMVAVALGFACCENLVYIFIYSGSDLETKIAVLILRSLFPIHPLAAAIQSIGVCRHDIENDMRFGVGRSILPAVLLHGSFDLAIMIASFLVAVNPDDEDFEEKAEIASLATSFVIFLLGVVYYLFQSRAQRKRLDELDCAAGSKKAGLLPTTATVGGDRDGDHALV